MALRRLASKYRVIIALLATGALLRLAYSTSFLASGQLQPDERDYVESAVGLLTELGFDKVVTHRVPPAVPVLYAAVFLFTGKSYLAVRAFQSLMFVVSGLTVYLLGREVSGKPTALFALAAAAAYPYFVYFAGFALTETAALTVIPAFLWLAVRSVRLRSYRCAAGFGAVLAIGALTRSSIVYFVLAIPLVYAIGWGVRNLEWPRATIVALVAFAMIYAPWVTVTHHYYGEVITTPTIGSGVMLYQTALRITMPNDAARLNHLREEVIPFYYKPAEGTHAARLAGDKHLRQEGNRIMRQNLEHYPSIVWQNFRRFWQFYPRSADGDESRTAFLFKLLGLASYGTLFPLILLGAVVGLRRFRELAALYGFIAYFTLVHIILYSQMRYRIPMDPVLLVFAGYGACFLLQRYAPKVHQWAVAISSFELREDSDHVIQDRA